ncbi:MAG: hypothetical protein NT175_02310 [Bacteroidetes bacterium]|nr:hypothetical protein [Bacteroidota bacterium]
MNILRFKTSVNCYNCIRAITPYLNKVAGITSWLVDIDDPAKILTVEGDSVKASDIVKALSQVGYKAEQLD